ncbi:MAG: FAD-dependent oxidoreductase [Oscillospiraceae bacterium]|jgi:succinate dehydrogenase/fumarate reductase flavoprotein subunit
MSVAIWPYKNETGETERIEADVLVLGGGVAGCMAAIAAARKGRRVVLVDKGAVRRSGAGGSGCDHWESAATNPCSKVTPEELLRAMMNDNDGYNNAISHYIECREGWDRLLDVEAMGGKIRDTEGEFKGADFRDEKTGLLFAYDYNARHTLRIWGTTFKPAMAKELRRLGVQVVERVMVTGLLTRGGESGKDCIGAVGFNTRTGKFYIFSGKATVMAMSRPARIWLFSAAYPGLCEFRPLNCIGDGHAMGWRIGAEFNMMEKSVRAEFSAAGRSYPPYSTGNNHNTWYPASLIDANGREIPYADRDGNILPDVKSRFYPAKNQPFFLKGGNIEKAKYEYDGPETLPYEKLSEMGYRLPFYADLSSMPESERRIIWGMMVGQEGKTNVPVYRYLTEAGFDPEKHVLQCYGTGWTSAEFLPQERQLFGLPGGFMNDWKLMTNIPGLFVGGDSLFSSNCYGHAASTGYYAGRHAADYASERDLCKPDKTQLDFEFERVYAPLGRKGDISWKELNHAISKTMQNYCGEQKRNELLLCGVEQLERYEKDVLLSTGACNPHELMRLLEVYDILTVSQLILQACLTRRQSCEKLEFFRADDNGEPPKPFLVIHKEKDKTVCREVPLDYAGDIKHNYEKYNADYIEEMKA